MKYRVVVERNKFLKYKVISEGPWNEWAKQRPDIIEIIEAEAFHTAEDNDGALIFTNRDGRVVAAFAANCWQSVREYHES